MFRLSAIISVTASLLVSGVSSPAHGFPIAHKAKQSGASFSVANAWNGRARCLQSTSQIGAKVEAELPQLLRASPANPQDDLSSPRGKRLAYMRARYGFNGSSAAGGESGWTADELDQLLATLADLPANAAPFDDQVMRPLVFDAHLRPNSQGAALIGGTAIIAIDEAGGIRVGPSWKTLSPNAQRVAIFHELAHEFLRLRGVYFDWQPHWRAAVKADEARAKRLGLASDRVSQYAKTNLDEDFAESAAAYRYMPEHLKQRAPARYELLKTWMFDGLEYLTDETCAPHAARSEQVIKLAAGQLALEAAAACRAPALIAAVISDEDYCSRRARATNIKSAWKTLFPQAGAVETAALDALLNSRRL